MKGDDPVIIETSPTNDGKGLLKHQEEKETRHDTTAAVMDILDTTLAVDDIPIFLGILVAML